VLYRSEQCWLNVLTCDGSYEETGKTLFCEKDGKGQEERES
jgi:hypothetical protein